MIIVAATTIILVVSALIPITANAQTQLVFPTNRYSVWDGCGISCGTYIGQFGPDNLTGSNTKSTSVTIQIIPQYPGGDGIQVPITGLLCSLDNVVPSPCPTQIASYSNLAVGQHNFNAIWITAIKTDPNPPVFTWKIIATGPPSRNQIIDNTCAAVHKPNDSE